MTETIDLKVGDIIQIISWTHIIEEDHRNYIFDENGCIVELPIICVVVFVTYDRFLHNTVIFINEESQRFHFNIDVLRDYINYVKI